MMTHYQYLQAAVVIAKAVKDGKGEAGQNKHADIFAALYERFRHRYDSFYGRVHFLKECYAKSRLFPP
jgi:hypothetical protein